MTKLFFATDIHGSDICWSKFLNAGKFYEADLLILGGDMTGKAIDLFFPDVPTIKIRNSALVRQVGDFVTTAIRPLMLASEPVSGPFIKHKILSGESASTFGPLSKPNLTPRPRPPMYLRARSALGLPLTMVPVPSRCTVNGKPLAEVEGLEGDRLRDFKLKQGHSTVGQVCYSGCYRDKGSPHR